MATNNKLFLLSTTYLLETELILMKGLERQLGGVGNSNLESPEDIRGVWTQEKLEGAAGQASRPAF